MPDGPSMPARPWSAAEPRWNADRMFSRFAVSNVCTWFIQTKFCSKQRNWEGLAAGRKHLHHGQLLPGSTESTDEDARPTKTCWSEGASPGRWEMQSWKTTLLPHIISCPGLLHPPPQPCLTQQHLSSKLSGQSCGGSSGPRTLESPSSQTQISWTRSPRLETADIWDVKLNVYIIWI